MRNYDATIGRWTTIAPYGEFWSPYLGMGNDPVNGVDPDGKVLDDYRLLEDGGFKLIARTNDPYHRVLIKKMS